TPELPPARRRYSSLRSKSAYVFSVLSQPPPSPRVISRPSLTVQFSFLPSTLAQPCVVLPSNRGTKSESAAVRKATAQRASPADRVMGGCPLERGAGNGVRVSSPD